VSCVPGRGNPKGCQEAGLETPIVIAGKIREPQHAEDILKQGKADIIGLCRALLCDPDWPLKAKEGREKDIVRCWPVTGVSSRFEVRQSQMRPLAKGELECP